MLQSYFGLRPKSEVNEVLAGVVTAVLPALKIAIQASDIDAALGHVQGFATQLNKGSGQTPSHAPMGFVRQLVQLAVQKSALPKLLHEFHRYGLLTKWALECVLQECAQKGETAVLKEAKEFAQARGVEITLAGFQLLVRNSSTDGAMLDLFDTHCNNFDISANTQVARLITEAAFRCHRTDVISKMVAGAAENKQVALLKCFTTINKIDESFAIFRACPQKTVCHYNPLIEACVNAHNLHAAERLAGEAAAVGAVDAVTYDTMIKAYLQNKDLQRMQKAMDAMRAAKLIPNILTFHKLIDATLKINIDDAWNLVKYMQDCGLKPNGITCSILLKSIQPCSRAVDVERTLALLNSLDEGMDEVLLGSTCEACIRVGRIDTLTQLLRNQRFGKKIQVKGAHTFGSLIRGHGFIKDISGAWEMWNEMRAYHIIPTTVTIGCMVEALVSNGDPDAGYDLIGELTNNEQTRPLVNSVVYGSVLKGFSRQQRFDCVWALYEEMLAKKVQFSIVTYDALIDACARNYEMSRLPPILKDMCQQKIEPNRVTFSTIIKGYCNEGRIEKALELFEDMKKTKDLTPDEITYNTLIDGCARMGYFENGMSLMYDMQESGVPPTNFTLSVIVKLGSRSNGPDKAFELCEEISEKYQIKWNVHVYNNLIHACTASGLLQRGLRVLEQMLSKQVHPNMRTYTLLLRSCIRAKSARDAAGLIRAASGLPGAHFRLVGFGTAASQIFGGLDRALIKEILEGIRGYCWNEELVATLHAELQNLPHMHEKSVA